MTVYSQQKHEFICTTEKSKLQISVIHDFLSNRSYWARGRSLEAVKRSIGHSVCFGLFRQNKQIGFARVISDYTIYAYILDVFILETERGKGLGKFLMESILSHPELKEVKKWTLGTEDAHGLYTQYGFTPLKKPQNHMELVK